MGSFYLPARVLSPESPGEPRSPSCLAGPTLPKHLPLRGAVVWLLPPPPPSMGHLPPPPPPCYGTSALQRHPYGGEVHTPPPPPQGVWWPCQVSSPPSMRTHPAVLLHGAGSALMH